MSMVEWFEFRLPGRVICAEHCVDSIGFEMDRARGHRVLVITDSGVKDAGLVEALEEGMESGSADIFGVFTGVPPHSEVSVVQDCYQLVKKLGADSLISLGGGSVIDTAKATAILMVEGGDLLDHHSAVYVPSDRMPAHIAIPTTAGSGSESTHTAAIADAEQKLKLIFQGPDLTPTVAMLDPVMTKTLPPELTATTGMDALSHCIEAIHSNLHEPITDGISLHAIRLIALYLRRAVADGADIEARTYMLIAANMGGIAFSNAYTGIVHALAHACGGHLGTAHGLANAVILPYGMEFNLKYTEQEIPVRYRMVAEALGIDVRGDDDLTAARKAVDYVRELASDIGMPTRLREAGVPADGLEAAARDSVIEGPIFNNPGECTYDDALDLFKRAY